MKASKIILGLTILFMLAASAISAQQEFIQTVTKLNTSCNYGCSVIDLPELNNNPAALIFVTPVAENGRNLNPHPIGAYFMYLKKWSIFNLDGTRIAEGAKFKVEYYLKPDSDRFVYKVQSGIPCIDRPGLNDNPNAQIRIFPTNPPVGGAIFNRDEIKVEYDPSVLKWCIANINNTPLLLNSAYNIAVSSGGAVVPNAPKIAPVSPTPAVSLPSAMQPKQTNSTTLSTAAPTASTRPQTPCTDEAARQTVGSWKRQQKDDLSDSDRSFPKDQFKPVLATAQKVIELLVKANPEFKGIQAYSYRNIRGDSVTEGGALPFGVTAGYFAYYCVPDTSAYKPEFRGQIRLGVETGTWINVYFNGLNRLLDRTTSDELFYFPRSAGQLNGLELFQLEDDGVGKPSQIVVIAPNGRLPYKPVSREQFLKNRLKFYQDRGGSLDTNDIAFINAYLSKMSPAERQTQAIVNDIGSSPKQNMFVRESDGGKRLVTIDKSFFDPKLPSQTIQFILVSLRWNDKNPAQSDTIRQFKQNFDFEALKKMLGK